MTKDLLSYKNSINHSPTISAKSVPITNIQSSPYRIERIGGLIYFINTKENSKTRVTTKSINEIKKNIPNSKTFFKIEVKGLSRAQMGQIASDLVKNSNKRVSLHRKTAETPQLSHQKTEFDIIIHEGDTEDEN